MEEWISDKFYSYFPSLNNNNPEEARRSKALARNLEYQEYLKKHGVSNVLGRFF